MQNEDALPLLLTEVLEPGSVVAAAASRIPELHLQAARKRGIYAEYVGFMSECFLAGIEVDSAEALLWVQRPEVDPNPLHLTCDDIKALAAIVERPRLSMVA